MSCVVQSWRKRGQAEGYRRGEVRGHRGSRKSALRGLPYRLINLFPENPCYSSEKRYLGILAFSPYFLASYSVMYSCKSHQLMYTAVIIRVTC